MNGAALEAKIDHVIELLEEQAAMLKTLVKPAVIEDQPWVNFPEVLSILAELGVHDSAYFGSNRSRESGWCKRLLKVGYVARVAKDNPNDPTRWKITPAGMAFYRRKITEKGG